MRICVQVATPLSSTDHLEKNTFVQFQKMLERVLKPVETWLDYYFKHLWWYNVHNFSLWAMCYILCFIQSICNEYLGTTVQGWMEREKTFEREGGGPQSQSNNGIEKSDVGLISLLQGSVSFSPVQCLNLIWIWMAGTAQWGGGVLQPSPAT